MSWLDLLILLIAFLTIYSGTRRGFISEIFDLLLIVSAFTLAVYLKAYIAPLFIQNFHWSKVYAHWVGFLLIFVPVGTGVFLLGCYVNDAVKGRADISEDMNQVLGGIFAAIKAAVFAVLILLLIGYIPTDKKFRSEMGRGFIVIQVDRAIPAAKQVVLALTQEKEGKYLVGKIQKARFPTKVNKLKNTGKN